MDTMRMDAILRNAPLTRQLQVRGGALSYQALGYHAPGYHALGYHALGCHTLSYHAPSYQAPFAPLGVSVYDGAQPLVVVEYPITLFMLQCHAAWRAARGRVPQPWHRRHGGEPPQILQGSATRRRRCIATRRQLGVGQQCVAT